MANIGSLVGFLTLNARQFSAELGKQKKGVEGFAGGMKAVGTAAKLYIAGMATQAVSTFMRSIDDSLERVDKLAKTIRLLGADAVEFQGLQFAAGLAGVDETSFNMGAQRFSRRLGGNSVEIQQGLGMLGLTPEIVKNAGDLETQLLVVADAFAQIEDQQVKIAAAQKLFDSEGVKMVSFLDQGAKKIIENVRDLESQGLFQNEDTLTAAEAASDANARAKKIVEAAWDRAAVVAGNAWARTQEFGIGAARQTLPGQMLFGGVGGDPTLLQDAEQAAGRIAGVAASNRERAMAAAQYGAINQAAAAQVQEDRRIQEMQLEEQRRLRERFDALQGVTRPPVPAMDRQVEVLNMGDAP